MRQLKPQCEIINETSITKKIERIARICYKSEANIKEGSDIKMIKALISKQHTAMLEHGDMAFIVTQTVYSYFYSLKMVMENELYSDEDTTKQCYLRFTVHGNRYVISGNIRAWLDFFDYFFLLNNENDDSIPIDIVHAFNKYCPLLENKYSIINNKDYKCTYIDDYSVLSPCERMVHETFTAVFVTDLLIQRELVRHRPASFAGESTRYCNYALDKFGNEITVIKPLWLDVKSDDYKTWFDGIDNAENVYMKLVNNGIKPELARDVLPVDTKCETAVTATLKEWKHILELRACDKTGPAHPKMHEVMYPLLGMAKAKYKFAFSDLKIN